LPQSVGFDFIPFKADSVRLPGEAREFRSKAPNDREAVRNPCANCISLVFGGEIRKFNSYTLCTGSLDDPSGFHPTFAIFAEGCPAPGAHPAGHFRPNAGLGIEV
jgi:Glutathione-dependent formaldehyde-activating enzyme